MEKIKKGIVEIENAKNLEQLKAGNLVVFKEIDIEIDYLWAEIAKLREGQK